MAYWWMHHYGSLTAKRHMCICNASTVKLLDRGTLSRKVCKKLAASNAKSATVHTTRAGRKVFTGSKFLKDTGSGA